MAGDRSVGWGDQLDSNPQRLAQQQDTFRKELAGPLLPSRESFRVFQAHALASTLGHGHRACRFTSKSLFLKRTVRPLVDAMLLLHGPAVALLFEDRAQVGAVIAIRARDRFPHAHVTTEKASGLVRVRAGHLHTDARIPFPVFAEHFGAFVQGGPRQRQRLIQPMVTVRRDIESPVLPTGERRAPDHDPVVKAGRFARTLNLGAVDQLGVQDAGRVVAARFLPQLTPAFCQAVGLLAVPLRLCADNPLGLVHRDTAWLRILLGSGDQLLVGPVGTRAQLLDFTVEQVGAAGEGLAHFALRSAAAGKVDTGPPMRPAFKFPEAFCGTGAALFSHQLMCGSGMAARKEGRQERQRVGFIRTRKELNLVREIDRFHGEKDNPVSEKDKTTTPRRAPSSARDHALWTVVQTPAPPALRTHSAASASRLRAGLKGGEQSR
jgi:hypothetical protein